MTVDSAFCPRCGNRLPARPPTQCDDCGYHLYVNARPTGSVIVVTDETFLALARASEPRAGWPDLPGGFCEGWEHPADAAIREAYEELGVRVRLDQFVGMYVGSYRHQGETVPVLDCFWLATIVSGEIRLDPAEASGYDWLPVRQPPTMAFETMDRALSDLPRLLDQRRIG